jgi:uncharacterized protein (DUF433 family)
VKTETVNVADRITKTPSVCGGDACIRGHRIPVWSLVIYRQLGATDAEVFKAYPTIDAEDLTAAWKYYESHREEIDEAIREEEEGYDEPME